MTSITLNSEVKAEHEALKPASLTWNDYMHILAKSIDPDKFQRLLEDLHREQYEEAVERARERYAQARKEPGALLSADEARKRVREEQAD